MGGENWAESLFLDIEKWSLKREEITTRVGGGAHFRCSTLTVCSIPPLRFLYIFTFMCFSSSPTLHSTSDYTLETRFAFRSWERKEKTFTDRFVLDDTILHRENELPTKPSRNFISFDEILLTISLKIASRNIRCHLGEIWFEKAKPSSRKSDKSHERSDKMKLIEAEVKAPRETWAGKNFPTLSNVCLIRPLFPESKIRPNKPQKSENYEEMKNSFWFIARGEIWEQRRARTLRFIGGKIKWKASALKRKIEFSSNLIKNEKPASSLIASVAALQRRCAKRVAVMSQLIKFFWLNQKKSLQSHEALSFGLNFLD